MNILKRMGYILKEFLCLFGLHYWMKTSRRNKHITIPKKNHQCFGEIEQQRCVWCGGIREVTRIERKYAYGEFTNRHIMKDEPSGIKKPVENPPEPPRRKRKNLEDYLIRLKKEGWTINPLISNVPRVIIFKSPEIQDLNIEEDKEFDIKKNFLIICQKCDADDVDIHIGEIGVVFIKCKKCGNFGSIKTKVIPCTPEIRKNAKKDKKTLVKI